MAMQTNLEALIEAAKHLTNEERKKLIEALHPIPIRRNLGTSRRCAGLGRICGKELTRKIISMRSETRGTTDAAYSGKIGGV
jgi:hypothetical protein